MEVQSSFGLYSLDFTAKQETVSDEAPLSIINVGYDFGLFPIDLERTVLDRSEIAGLIVDKTVKVNDL